MSIIQPAAPVAGHASASVFHSVKAIAPGVAMTAAIAAVAFGLHRVPLLSTLSPMILAILIGIALRNSVGTPSWAKPGIAFSLRRILRAGIILLGLQLTASQVAEIGVSGVAIIATTLLATFFFTKALGRMLGVERKLAELIAVGTSICGASAVIATNTVTRAPDEDVAYAVACITVFGSLAMFTYPLLPGLLQLDPQAYGLWAGASIHEIAQVVAAAFQDGSQAGSFGTVAKLSRVMLLAPMVIALGLFDLRRAQRVNRASAGGDASGDNNGSRAKAPLPWFVLGFIALVGLNSLVTVPADAKAAVVTATTFLLAMALAAMGLETDIARLRAKGLRPALLGLAASLFIAGFSLVLVKAIG